MLAKSGTISISWRTIGVDTGLKAEVEQTLGSAPPQEGGIELDKRDNRRTGLCCSAFA